MLNTLYFMHLLKCEYHDRYGCASDKSIVNIIVILFVISGNGQEDGGIVHNL